MEYFIKDPSDFDNISFKTNDRILYTCKRCGKPCNILFIKRNINIHKLMMCRSCHLALHNINHHDKYDKMKENLIKNKGVQNVSQLTDVKNKVKETMNSKYGGYTLSSNKLRKKYEKTNIERYGVSNPFAYGNKMFEDYMNEKYGGYTLSSPILKDNTVKNIKQTFKEKYGQETYLHSEDYKNKMNEKYGEDTPYLFGSKLFTDLMLKKYGCKSFSETPSFKEMISYIRETNPELFQSKKIVYYGLSFDSIPEFCVFIYCMDAWIPIARNYNIGFDYIDSKGIIHKTYPDFIINDKLIEIKGSHFFKEDGTMYLPYRKPEWSDEEYKYMCDLYERKRQCLINNNVIIYKDTDPWIIECVRYVYFTYGKDWINLFSKSNPLNICHGYSPFDINKEDEYCPINGLGLSPFNI